MWFTVQNGNFIGRFSPGLGETTLISVPTPRARPYGIELDSQGRPWVVLFGTNKVATVDPGTLALKTYDLPDAAARPRRIAITSDDMIWYVDYARGYLGRLDPKTGQVKEWPGPGGSTSRPYAMTADDRGRLWFFETNPGPNRLVGFDPKREIFFSVNEIQSGGGTVRHMVFEKGQREIWFGTDTNTIGRAQIPD
jgi:virginiamycin B lyase